MNSEPTSKTVLSDRRSGLRKGIAVLMIGLLAVVVYWVAGHRPTGLVELSFEGMKTRVISSGGSSRVALFRLRNNSATPISYYGFIDRKPVLLVHELRLQGRQVDIVDDVTTPWYLEWRTLNPGEEIEVEKYIASRNRFWDVELQYVEGNRTGTAIQYAENGPFRGVKGWKMVKSGRLWPVNWGL
ncbi:MAG: hypothetical protein K0Q55_1514 [Verrucomicrobia bacterium]|jgi:hypothetical protein|nr:hypothetical protein [Verrucomicrobiota bacterium]